MTSLSKLAGLVVLCASLVQAQTTVTVQLGTTFQTMDGFGFSEAFGHANDLFNYPAATQKQVLDYLFSSTVGAGMTIIRNRIGSGGAGDSILPTSPGCPTCTPNYVWDSSDGNQVWFSKQAMSYGVTTIYADAWSAPGFMKTNNNDSNGGTLCGVTGSTCSSGNWTQAYANFLVQYIKFYAQSGVNITHVGFLNEPEYTPTYSSMNSNGQQASDFIKVLSPTIKAAGLSTKITCCDSEGWNNQITMTNAITSAGAMPLLGVVTSHAYSSQPNTPLNTPLNVWQTEYADLSDSVNPNNWYSSGAAGEGMTWANSIYNGIVNSKLSAYLYWIGAEPGSTNSALILTSGTTITVSKRLWAFAQWSRYVRPGAVRLGTATSGTANANLKFSAFKNPDGSVSVQVLNNGASAASVSVSPSGFTTTAAQAFLSDQGTDLGSLATTLSGGVVSASVPAHAMVTFVLNGAPASTSSTSSVGSTTASSTSVISTTTTTTTTTTSVVAPPTGCQSAEWGQCGGTGWTGCNSCASGTTCQVLNPCEYFQMVFIQC
ncbi:glycoside hydrolase [Roridomyces roridus]|uniref:Glycoside hydrolase n=1 Tax=Roridomyces roridus TaxID=1738132 RepID=A0AAD7BIR7_9AGAR|nr:glycoside hydrolase [Roridomyces roridus]